MASKGIRLCYTFLPFAGKTLMAVKKLALKSMNSIGDLNGVRDWRWSDDRLEANNSAITLLFLWCQLQSQVEIQVEFRIRIHPLHYPPIKHLRLGDRLVANDSATILLVRQKLVFGELGGVCSPMQLWAIGLQIVLLYANLHCRR